MQLLMGAATNGTCFNKQATFDERVNGEVTTRKHGDQVELVEVQPTKNGDVKPTNPRTGKLRREKQPTTLDTWSCPSVHSILKFHASHTLQSRPVAAYTALEC